MTIGSYPNEVYSLFAFISFILCCIPFPWHLEAWNTGTCFFMAWTGLACLNQFINSIIWSGNVINWAPVWCDISSRIIVGTAVALPASFLCINRRLYHIASVRSVTVTKAEKRRAVMVDVAISLGIPVLQMVIQYIPQGHRFDIWEDIGCFPFTYETPVGLVLSSLPPVILGLVSAVYSILSIRAFSKSRAQFKELMPRSNLTSDRYLRLMFLAGTETVITVPIALYFTVQNAKVLQPWKGWADTHYHFSRVGQYPLVTWRNTLAGSNLEMFRWLVVGCAFLFFIFFGFAEEARKNYRSVVQSVAKHVGVSTGGFGSGFFSSTGSKSSGTTNSSNGGGVLPVFVKQDVLHKRDSFDSLSDMSASFSDVSGVLNEKSEKAAPTRPVSMMSYEGLVLPDLGGALEGYKNEPYSPTPTSGPSSASSVSSLPDSTRPPPPAVTRPDSAVEISSVRFSRTYDGVDHLPVPPRTLNMPTPRSRKHSLDGSSFV